MRWQINGVMMILVIKTSRIRAAKAALARPDGRVDGREAEETIDRPWCRAQSGLM